MKNYVKAVLYAYPTLKGIGAEYQTHIQNKAVLSYRSDLPALALVEYLASEIVYKRKLEWLCLEIEKVLGKLSLTERTLIAVRYFGVGKRKKPLSKATNELPSRAECGSWSESRYFRTQRKLYKKVEAMLRVAGVTEEVFDRDFAALDIFAGITRFVNGEKDGEISKREREFLNMPNRLFRTAGDGAVLR